MKLNSLNKNKRIFTNLKSVIFTRWADETTLDDVSYDVVNIIGDSVTIEQDDNTLNKIDHEFSDSMLYNTEVVGNKKLYCECIDLDNDVIANLFGWNVTDDGDAFALSDYKELYCKVEISFNSTDDIIVLPKLRMDSKAMFTSLKNDSSRGLISGTCYPAFIRIHDSEENLTWRLSRLRTQMNMLYWQGAMALGLIIYYGITLPTFFGIMEV